jgi:hypothetical protein
VRSPTCCRQSQVPLAGNYQPRQFAQVIVCPFTPSNAEVRPTTTNAANAATSIILLCCSIVCIWLNEFYPFVCLTMHCYMHYGYQTFKIKRVRPFLLVTHFSWLHGGHCLSTIWVMTLLALVFDMISYGV